MEYILYHTTNRAAAEIIMVDGFQPGELVYLATCPWKIGVKGRTVVEIIIDLDEESMSLMPGGDTPQQVNLSSDFINQHLTGKRILSTEERDRLIDRYRPPGSWPVSCPE